MSLLAKICILEENDSTCYNIVRLSRYIYKYYETEVLFMDSKFQRIGSISNSHVGKDFELEVLDYFNNVKHMSLERNVSVNIGLRYKKPKIFDLGSEKEKIIVECKSHTWTINENVPSAKLTTWDSEMFKFYIAPKEYRKLFVVLKSFSPYRKKTLLEYYIEKHKHLIPDDVELYEFDMENKTMNKIG